MRRTVIINQKGGVGKSTTAANLGVALARENERVLLIDLDPQAHLSMHLGIDPDSGAHNTYTLLTARHGIAQARSQLGERLWIIPAHIDLAAAETELVSVIGREVILRDALLADDADYDQVLIDCPPSLGLLTLNGLCAADEVVIPMQAHFLALQGVGKLLETIQLVHQRINTELEVRGVLLCMHDAGTRLSGEVEQDLKSFFAQARGGATPWSQARVFETVIRRNIKLAECPSYGQSIFDYAPKSNGAVDYGNLARELLAAYRTPQGAAASFTVKLATADEAPPDANTDGDVPLAYTG